MSKTHLATASPSNFEVIFEKALKTYKKTTRQDRTVHPIFTQLQACDSSAAIRTILQEQIDQFIQSRSGDERLKNWLNPTINVLYAFSSTLAGGVGLVMSFYLSYISLLIHIEQVFPAANVIFAGAGVLLLVNALVYLHVPALVTPGFIGG
jgi:hypothetical protein